MQNTYGVWLGSSAIGLKDLDLQYLHIKSCLPFVQNTYGVWLGSSAIGLKDLARVHLVLCI